MATVVQVDGALAPEGETTVTEYYATATGPDGTVLMDTRSGAQAQFGPTAQGQLPMPAGTVVQYFTREVTLTAAPWAAMDAPWA